ncbi:hypothetical protein SLOPH_1666 [Spraguea lophii 42_110]|uniref:Uncharacterized protein n=1 Tax=Spraguea lophii (strain 42_110) TaxID=1358809 RepID=S7W8W6_SPRLO|nr:hypothetical protein SLOPH_1666 [Spraguea lophii 42_110]
MISILLPLIYGNPLASKPQIYCNNTNPPITPMDPRCLPYTQQNNLAPPRYLPIRTSPSIQNRIIKPPRAGDPFKEILKTNPELSESIKKILEYSGIMTPWNQVMDFFDVNQRQMPDPYMLYMKIKDILKLLDSVKEKISEELMKVETYINRAETYAEENHKRLKRNMDQMTHYYKKIQKSKDQGVKSEYIQKFEKIKRETQGIINRYMGLKNWLFKIMAYFKQLFN